MSLSLYALEANRRNGLVIYNHVVIYLLVNVHHNMRIFEKEEFQAKSVFWRLRR